MGSAANNIVGRVRTCSNPGISPASVNVIARRFRLAEGAAAPGQAAAAAPAPAQTAAAAAPAATAPAKANPAASAASKASAAASTAAPAASKAAPAAMKAASAAMKAPASVAAAAAAAASKSELYARLGVSEVIFVEEMERCQADVGDFLLMEEGDLKRRRILPEYIGYRSGGG
jgi:hypothetical protein